MCINGDCNGEPVGGDAPDDTLAVPDVAVRLEVSWRYDRRKSLLNMQEGA
jgi:hypothetical protein